MSGWPPLVIVIKEFDITFGIRSLIYYEQMLIWLPDESIEVITIRSAGLLVGGDRKLLI